MTGPGVIGLTRGVLVALEDLDLFEAVEDSEAEVLEFFLFLEESAEAAAVFVLLIIREKTHVRIYETHAKNL